MGIKYKNLTHNASQFIKNYVSCNYLFNMLSELSITNQVKDKTNFKLQSQFRKMPTIITTKYLSLNQVYNNFVDMYLQNKTPYENIKQPQGLRSDWIRNIYNSVPGFLLEEIGEKDQMYKEFLQIPKLLVESSIDSTKWSLFEEYIAKAFNLFRGVKAQTIGRPSQPDSLSHYLKDDFYFVLMVNQQIKN